MLQGKKVLLIVNDMEWFWSHRLPLARAIIAEGADLHLATNGAAGNTDIRALGITGHNLPAHTGSLNPLGQAKLALSIARALRHARPDIVHAITLRHAFFTGLASRILRTPRAVFTVAGLGLLFDRDRPVLQALRAVIVPLFRFAFGGEGRMVIFQNPDDAKALIRSGAVDRERSAVIRGSGVDTSQFAYAAEQSGSLPRVLFCSRLLRAKGIAEFVHAARILKSKGVDAIFEVAGDIAPGNHDSITRAELEDWVSEGCIEWLGKRNDMPALMARAAIVTLPSYYGEGVPKVLLEAASCGRAIVTTDMPGCREAVEDGVTGLLVEPKNAWPLAEAIERLLRDPDLRRTMGEKGRARIEADFTVEKVNARTLAVYRRLLTGSGAEPSLRERKA